MKPSASILIVDDESQNRRLLEVLLRPEGYVTRTAVGGEEALASIAEDPPDLILLDFLMRGIDGPEVASAVKANPATRSIPIIMLTALDHHDARLAALEAGVEEFLTKPFERAELWLRVRNLLRLKELSDLLESHRSTLEAEVQARTADLEIRAAELQVANDAIRRFTDVAAHNLRTPLASIMGFSECLTESWEKLSEEDRRKFVAAINRQSRNLSILVDDILVSASIDDDKMMATPGLIVLLEAIDQCLERGSGDAARVDVSCAPGLVVRVDERHLGRILDIYVQNALRYGEPPVRIHATRVGDVIKVQVLDSGLGIPPEFVARLFTRFARADTPVTTAQKGTGLGLSIVRGLAEVNGGQARYEPNTPIGSCFMVELPAGEMPGWDRVAPVA